MLFATIRIGKITQKLSKLSSIDALHNKGHFLKTILELAHFATYR